MGFLSGLAKKVGIMQTTAQKAEMTVNSGGIVTGDEANRLSEQDQDQIMSQVIGKGDIQSFKVMLEAGVKVSKGHLEALSSKSQLGAENTKIWQEILDNPAARESLEANKPAILENLVRENGTHSPVIEEMVKSGIDVTKVQVNGVSFLDHAKANMPGTRF